MTMGTASTLACKVEALGVGLPGPVLARQAGRRRVEMVRVDRKLSSILTREAFETAIKTVAAIDGSPNAVIHPIATPRRLEVPLSIDDFARLGSALSCQVNLQPSGPFLMEDFCHAAGPPAMIQAIYTVLHPDAIKAKGCTLDENAARGGNLDPAVIKSMSEVGNMLVPAPRAARAGH